MLRPRPTRRANRDRRIRECGPLRVRIGCLHRETLSLKPLHTDKCPFATCRMSHRGVGGGGVTAEQMREMQWTKPLVVAQIKFVERTADNRIRHAVFLGLRDDKPAREATREA